MLNFFKIVPFTKFFQMKSGIIAYCANSTYKIVCNIDDEVQVFWNDWDSITLQIKNVKYCCIPENADYLVLLSQDTITSKIFINVYNISNQIGRKSAILVGFSIIENSSKASALNAFSLSESELCIAIGLGNGSILFYKNSLQKEILCNAFKDFNVTTKPIKGISFFKSQDNVNMFVCSDSGIYCYTISNNLRLYDKYILDDKDSAIHCITCKPCELDGEQYLVVAQDNALYFYTAEGRGPCYAMSGNKQTLEWFGKYLIIILESKCLHSHHTTSRTLIYDIYNKIIVLDKELEEEIVCILPISNYTNCLIILKNGVMCTLREHEMRYKLSCVIKEKMYDTALKFLEESKVNLDIASEIHIQYGDYMLQRGDTSGAVNAYCKTIGTTPPFLIIKKLKDFRFNDVLNQYLLKLVQTEFKMPEHEALLHNCARRINLPKSTLRLFEIQYGEQQQHYIYFATTNHNLNVTFILNSIKQELYFSPKFFYEYSSIEAIKFLSDYGYYLIKEYPDGLKELTKYTLSDSFLKSNMFQNILLPLSLINKLCAPYFIEKLINDGKNVSTFNILTELLLQMWYKDGFIDTNFVVEFIKSNQLIMGIENTFIFCRHYKFWPGIKMMYDTCGMEILSTHCLIKCVETFSQYICTYSKENSNKKLNQMIQILKKGNLTKNDVLIYITDAARNIINSNPFNILNILYSFVNCKYLLLSHLDELLVQEFFLTYFNFDNLNSLVCLLTKRVLFMEKVVHNYLKRPIEFRNRSCDICKQTLKQPSIYFLCQHSFHRECLIQFGENFRCIVCMGKKISIMEIEELTHLKDNIKNSSCGSKSNVVKDTTKKIVKLVFKCDQNSSNSKAVKNYNKNLSKSENLEASRHFQSGITKNFIYDEYDDNLNPFKQN